MAQPSFRELLTAIKKDKDIPAVMLLMGEEAYYIDKLVEAVENFSIGEADKDFNFHIYYGNDADMEAIVATAQQYPVMAPRKVVILKEAQSAFNAKAALEKLAPYVSRPNKTTLLVVAFKGDNLNATSKLMKAAKDSGAVVFKSAPVKDWDLSGHVRDYCTQNGFNIEEKAVSLLCDYIGTPLSKIFGEVDKLMAIKADSKRIQAEDIEKHIGVSKDFNNFELVKAIATKDYQQSVRIIRYFAKNPKPNPVVVTTAVLFKHFMSMVVCHYLADKSDTSMMQALGLKSPYGLRDIKDGLRRYNARQAVAGVHAIRDFDRRSKGIESMQNEYDLLQELVFRLITA